MNLLNQRIPMNLLNPLNPLLRLKVPVEGEDCGEGEGTRGGGRRGGKVVGRASSVP